MSASSSGNDSVYGNYTNSNDNRVKAKSKLGWAAFDHQQRHKHHNWEPEVGLEPYPLLPGLGPAQMLSNKKKAPLEKPFSSVAVAPMNFPSLTDARESDKDLGRRVPVTNSAEKINTDVHMEAYQELNNLHPWADQTLIQDVLDGVNYNMQEALSLLEAMSLSGREAKDKNIDSSGGNAIFPFSIANDFVKDSYVEFKEEDTSSLLMGTTTKPPAELEPEWEEDDVYLIHRKDAIKMMRSASRHSKASNDAFLRGDHASAHHLSLKAHEEWSAAEKLNAKAAMEILTLRNDKNDPWTLDLHGLHAAEAVMALMERLLKVESLVVSSNEFGVPAGDNKESSLLASESTQSLNRGNMEKHERQHPSLRRRSMLLQVITGKGNHSRGAAALPSAIRNFLSANGYHFDETRPGVIMVRPKFRHRHQ